MENDDLDAFRDWYRLNTNVPHTTLLYLGLYYSCLKILQELILVHQVNLRELNPFCHYNALEYASCSWYRYNTNPVTRARVILLLCQHGVYTLPLSSLDLRIMEEVNNALIYPVQAMLHLVRVDKYPKDIWRRLKSYLY